jgi:cell division transport system permease protein
MFYSVLTNFQHIVRTAEEGVSVTVFFKHGVTEEQIDQIRIAVEEREEVAQVNYVSAEDAWASFSEEYLGEYAEGFTENPLEDSANLEIYLSDISKQSELVSYLESLEEVRMVNRSELTANTLSGANRLIGYASVAIIGILLLVAVFLISNTIATGIQSHKDEINIMKYIGATDAFVRGPFIVEGILIGLVGSLITVRRHLDV